MKPVAPASASTTRTVTARKSSELETRRSYQLASRSKLESTKCWKRDGWPDFSTRAAIIGVMVSATMPEMITAPASVTANSRNSAPVRPPVKASGENTAASVSVIATIGPVISFMPTIAASSGVSPSSMWRWMFSTTTIASSTTSPIASTIASSVRRLIE